MHLILTGATGLCGSAVLDAMVRMKDVTKISILSRRPVRMAEDLKDPRINVIIHKDFEKYDANLLSQLTGATGCVWALGISQTQVSKEEYVKITKDFTLRAVEAFETLGTEEKPFHFVYVSGHGATIEPGRFAQTFALVKGETEVLLAGMHNRNKALLATSIRPCFIDFATHDAIKPYIPTQEMYKNIITPILGPPIRHLAKSYWSPTQRLGEFMTEMAMGKWDDRLEGPGIEKVGDFRILGNVGFRRLAGLH
ncbi:putative nucleoside-diphosphate-sugar epimerase [Cryphonectria parasitica EP155]|uniref:Nucleoside-diphosphate-sugar epimerase n=1 Tax=Cryphonectria parasitica (strain ATCC 38755 / EP155) TaxID=660469 RepID=A0A9P4Y736_CRYP1|nr:putative nucleoside-diphosphate-sugar epimerase [Cryphonectria parasitica EP155]KAF3768127.1 putative nucleoside-diphosphate-sugar epimerase [Cryphonectria parasitica EP155]